MQNQNTLIENSKSLRVVSRKGAAQELHHVLSSRLPSLYGSAYRLLGNSADAEDAVQDALLAAYTHLDQFKGQSQMSVWVTAIVRNCARMQLRLRLRHITLSLDEPLGEDADSSMAGRLADDEPTPEDQCKHSELSKRLKHLTSQLSPTLLKTYQLRDVEGLSIRETAEILGIPSGTVKAQLARARKKLKQLMRQTLRHQSRNLSDAYVQDAAA